MLWNISIAVIISYSYPRLLINFIFLGISLVLPIYYSLYYQINNRRFLFSLTPSLSKFYNKLLLRIYIFFCLNIIFSCIICLLFGLFFENILFKQIFSFFLLFLGTWNFFNLIFIKIILQFKKIKFDNKEKEDIDEIIQKTNFKKSQKFFYSDFKKDMQNRRFSIERDQLANEINHNKVEDEIKNENLKLLKIAILDINDPFITSSNLNHLYKINCFTVIYMMISFLFLNFFKFLKGKNENFCFFSLFLFFITFFIAKNLARYFKNELKTFISLKLIISFTFIYRLNFFYAKEFIGFFFILFNKFLWKIIYFLIFGVFNSKSRIFFFQFLEKFQRKSVYKKNIISKIELDSPTQSQKNLKFLEFFIKLQITELINEISFIFIILFTNFLKKEEFYKEINTIFICVSLEFFFEIIIFILILKIFCKQFFLDKEIINFFKKKFQFQQILSIFSEQANVISISFLIIFKHFDKF